MSTRRPLIAGNWKMYKTIAQAQETTRELIQRTAAVDGIDIMIAPPFTAVGAVATAAMDSRVAIGAQDLFWEKEGAYTGQIAPEMLVEAGCRYVIIGHSERRQHFGETDDTVNRKMTAALEAQLVPIFCIGESEAQREADETFSVLDKQVKRGLKDLFAKDLQDLVIAYEPIWAIGTGKTATSEQAQAVHRFLRQALTELFDETFAQSVRILYGGSVKPDNITELMSMEDIDGALVGGASLKAETFAKIVSYK